MEGINFETIIQVVTILSHYEKGLVTNTSCRSSTPIKEQNCVNGKISNQ